MWTISLSVLQVERTGELCCNALSLGIKSQMCCSGPGVFTFNLSVYSVVMLYIYIYLFILQFLCLTFKFGIYKSFSFWKTPYFIVSPWCYPDPLLEFGGNGRCWGSGLCTSHKRSLDITLAPPPLKFVAMCLCVCVCSILVVANSLVHDVNGI